jgi:hypothetical protein
MKRNIWEFFRTPDGTYAAFHNGKLLSDSIPCLRVRFAKTMGFAARNTTKFAGSWIALENAQLT